jgi:TonB family protein
MRMPIQSGLAVACVLLSACAATPPPAAAPAAPVPAPAPTLLATPVSEAGPAGLSARVTQVADNQMLLRFTVLADGAVQAPQVVMSTLPADTQAAVLPAFSLLRFKPYLEHGKPVARAFIYPLFFGADAATERTKFFCLNQKDIYQPAKRCDVVVMDHWRLYRITVPYPAELLANPISGAVTLGFDIVAGLPVNAKVLKSTPPGVFDAAALTALGQWVFESMDPAGAPPAAQHASVTVNFVPPAAAAPDVTKPKSGQQGGGS